MDLMVAGVGVLSLLLAGPPPAPSDKAKELPLREPMVRSVFPMGGQAGRRVLMEIEGDFLDRASAIRCECDDLTGNIRKANAVRLQAEIEDNRYPLIGCLCVAYHV